MKLHLWLPCLLISLFCLSPKTCTAGSGIAIIVSRQIQPYMVVVNEIKAGIDAVFYEYNLNGDKRNVRKIIPEILSKKPDLIVAIGTEAAEGCSGRTSGIPTIFTMVLNPYILKLNMSGVAMDISARMQIQSLKKILPNAKKIGVIYNPRVSASLISAAKKENISLLAFPVSSEPQVMPALKNMLSQQIDAFWLVPDPIVASQSISRYIMETTIKANVPVMSPSPSFVKNGALFSISAGYNQIGKQTVRLIQRILDNGNTQISIEEPKEPLLTINLKAAELMDIVIPANVQNLADEVVE
ncbi:ABC transporter substrate-binding protein [bacterium]|nr:ABC transporter substrate-binding protein [bacterium]MBU1752385.1 ABC transporter substrate-binding protein [bacterium]